MISKKIIYVFAILSFQFLTVHFLSAQITEEEEIVIVEEEPVEEIFKVVEEMPRFPGCEGKGLARNEYKSCSEKEMLKYLYSNLKYPKIARQNGMEGRVVLQFVIERDGSISGTKVVRDIGGGCGNEAARVVNSMPKWFPGKQRGRPVRVQYTLPVLFKIDEPEEEEEAPVFEDQSIDDDEVVIEVEEIEEIPTEETIFKVVEEMPRFSGCEDQDLNKNELRKCSQEKMLKYLYSNIKYPSEAKKNGIKGRVILRFVVEEDGSLSNVKILRDIGSGCGEEAARVVKSMPEWIPGKQRGKPVKVQYTLPVVFRF